jgi:hypothetical protein
MHRPWTFRAFLAVLEGRFNHIGGVMRVCRPWPGGRGKTGAARGRQARGTSAVRNHVRTEGTESKMRVGKRRPVALIEHADFQIGLEICDQGVPYPPDIF